MSVGARVAGVLPVAGASLAAAALAGVAVFTVHQAGCSDPGHYIQRDDGQVELVSGCVDANDLPAVRDDDRRVPAKPALNQLSKLDPGMQAP